MFTALAIGFSSALLVAQAPNATRSAAGTIPPRIEQFIERCETMRRGAIIQLEFELRGLRAGGAGAPQNARRIEKIEANLASLRANKEPVVPALRFPPEVGDIGRLPQLACHIDQILSDDEMLVQCTFKIPVRAVKNFQPRLETVVERVRFLVRGMPTGKMHEGADVQMLDVFEIAGKHSFTSASGKSVTVRVLSPFDMKAIEPHFRAMTER